MDDASPPSEWDDRFGDPRTGSDPFASVGVVAPRSAGRPPRTNVPSPPLLGGLDLALIALACVTILFGLAVVSSAGRPEAVQMTGTFQRLPEGWLQDVLIASPSLWFVIKQVVGIGIGAVAGAVVVFGLSRERLMEGGYVAFVLAFLLMLAVQTPLGTTINGARRWLDLGVMNLQPSEFAKIGLVWALATFLGRNQRRMRDPVPVLIPVGIGVGLMGATVFLQSDLGTMVLMGAITLMALYVAGMDLRWFILLGAICLALGALMIVIEPYRMSRIESFRNPWANRLGDGYQIINGWISIAAGGLWGEGLGAGYGQRHLPEAHTDMIMAIVAEETGVIGWLFVVALQLLLLERGLNIARRGRGVFDVLLAGGISCLLAAQAVINLGVVGGLLPNKGLVLPFVSYGASAAMAHTFGLALLLRVGLENRRPLLVATSPGTLPPSQPGSNAAVPPSLRR